MLILYTPKFRKEYSKLPDNIKDLFEEKESLFREDVFNVSLKTHKLHGKFDGYLSFSINYKYRIIFSYTENKKDVKFHSIGTHDIYE